MDAMAPESKNAVLLTSLKKFYSAPANMRALADALGSKSLSLRVLDWCVTNYSKKNNVVYAIQRHGETRSFNVFLEYKSQLKGYSKKLFDPFSRQERLAFPMDEHGKTLETTIGQLNFFRWAIANDVLKYCMLHAREIEEDMLHRLNYRNRAGEHDTETKRRELSKAAIKSLTHTKVVLTLRY